MARGDRSRRGLGFASAAIVVLLASGVAAVAAKPEKGVYWSDEVATISFQVKGKGSRAVKDFEHVDIFCGDALKNEKMKVKRSGKFSFEGEANGFEAALEAKFVSDKKAKGEVDIDPLPGSDPCSVQDEKFTAKLVD